MTLIRAAAFLLCTSAWAEPATVPAGALVPIAGSPDWWVSAEFECRPSRPCSFTERENIPVYEFIGNHSRPRLFRVSTIHLHYTDGKYYRHLRDEAGRATHVDNGYVARGRSRVQNSEVTLTHSPYLEGLILEGAPVQLDQARNGYTIGYFTLFTPQGEETGDYWVQTSVMDEDIREFAESDAREMQVPVIVAPTRGAHPDIWAEFPNPVAYLTIRKRGRVTRRVTLVYENLTFHLNVEGQEIQLQQGGRYTIIADRAVLQQALRSEGGQLAPDTRRERPLVAEERASLPAGPAIPTAAVEKFKWRKAMVGDTPIYCYVANRSAGDETANRGLSAAAASYSSVPCATWEAPVAASVSGDLLTVRALKVGTMALPAMTVTIDRVTGNLDRNSGANLAFPGLTFTRVRMLPEGARTPVEEFEALASAALKRRHCAALPSRPTPPAPDENAAVRALCDAQFDSTASAFLIRELEAVGTDDAAAMIPRIRDASALSPELVVEALNLIPPANITAADMGRLMRGPREDHVCRAITGGTSGGTAADEQAVTGGAMDELDAEASQRRDEPRLRDRGRVRRRREAAPSPTPAGPVLTPDRRSAWTGLCESAAAEDRQLDQSGGRGSFTHDDSGVNDRPGGTDPGSGGSFFTKDRVANLKAAGVGLAVGAMFGSFFGLGPAILAGAAVAVAFYLLNGFFNRNS